MSEMSDVKITKLACYVQEYSHPVTGGLCARLRDKVSDKKVSIVTSDLNVRNKFLAFLSQARIQKVIMPTVFDRDGTDIVAVRGLIVEETKDEISVAIQVHGGGFLFE